MQTSVAVAEERPGGAGEVLGARAHERPAGREVHGPIPAWRGMAWSSARGASRGDHDLNASPHQHRHRHQHPHPWRVPPLRFVAAAQQRLPPWPAQWCPFRVTPKCHCAVIITHWHLYPIEGVDPAHDRSDSDRR